MKNRYCKVLSDSYTYKRDRIDLACNHTLAHIVNHKYSTSLTSDNTNYFFAVQNLSNVRALIGC